MTKAFSPLTTPGSQGHGPRWRPDQKTEPTDSSALRSLRYLLLKNPELTTAQSESPDSGTAKGGVFSGQVAVARDRRKTGHSRMLSHGLTRIRLHWLSCLPRAARVALRAAFGRRPCAAIRAGGRRDKLSTDNFRMTDSRVFETGRRGDHLIQPEINVPKEGAPIRPPEP